MVLIAGICPGPVHGTDRAGIPAARIALGTLPAGNHAPMNISNIAMWFGRDGYSGGNPYSNNSGIAFPEERHRPSIATGWCGRGVLDDDAHAIGVGGSTYAQGCQPGPILPSGVAADPDDPAVRTHRVRRVYATADLRQETLVGHVAECRRV
jgi:hypothetical protein